MGGFQTASSAIWGAAFVALANALATLVGVYAVDVYGRRPLVLVSLVVVMMGLLLLALAFGLGDSLGGVRPVFTMTSLVIYLVGFSPGMGPMPWTINSEIYDIAFRSHGTAAATATNWICNLVVAMTFLDLCRVVSTTGAFLLYAACAVISFGFFYKYMPETKGKTLEEISSLFGKDKDVTETGFTPLPPPQYLEGGIQ